MTNNSLAGRTIKSKSHQTRTARCLNARAEINGESVVATLYDRYKPSQKRSYVFELAAMRKMTDYELIEERLMPLLQENFGAIHDTDTLIGTHSAAEGLAKAIREALGQLEAA